MKRLTVMLVTCLVATTTALATGADFASAAGGTVEGIVTDTTGQPIAGATVVVQRSTFESFGFRATTDVAGHYSIAGIFAGTWKVGATAPGHALRWGNAARFADGTAINVVDDTTASFEVALPSTTAAIEGTVTDPDGLPVAGIRVEARFDAEDAFLPNSSTAYYGQATTDSAGHYSITGLAPNEFIVTFATRYWGESGPIPPDPLVGELYANAHDPGSATPVALTESVTTGGIDAQLELGATLSGLVTDAAGNPLPDVSVYVQETEFGGTITEADGHYRLIGLPAGEAQLYAYDEATGTPVAYRAPGSTAPFTPIPLEFGGVYTGFDIQFPDYGVVHAAVVRPDGSLAPRALVACLDPSVPVVLPPPLPFWAPTVSCNAVTAPVSNAATLPVGRYNAVGTEGAGGFDASVFNVSAQTTFDVTAAQPIDCTFVLGGPASCTPTDPGTDDGDSIIAAIEDGAPNAGDGNADGIRDATQANVTSLPDNDGTGYVTFVVAADLEVTRAEAARFAGSFFQPETGTLYVTVAGLPLGGATDLTILRTEGGLADELASFAYSTGTSAALPADFNGTTIVAHLVDGSRFDQDGGPFAPSLVDGTIKFSATPVVADHVPPAIICPSPEPEFLAGSLAIVTATVTDEGSGVSGSVTLERQVFPSLPGPGSVTFTARDLAGNVATQACGYTVVARPIDVTPPTVECFPTLPRFAVGTAESRVWAFASDDSGPATGWLVNRIVDTSQPGLFEELLTATDLAGNSTTIACSFEVFVPDLTPPTIVCFEHPTFLLADGSRRVYASAIDETAPNWQWVVSSPVQLGDDGEFTVSISATDDAGNSASVDCPYTVVSDFDGVASAIEDGAPNEGDGNTDGIRDRFQNDVASLPEPSGGGYATIVDRFGQWFASVSTSSLDDAPAPPPGIELTSGIYEVVVDSSIASPQLWLSHAGPVDRLASLAGESWTPMPFLVTDGGIGDADGAFDRKVTLRIAAANIDSTPPTIECPAPPEFLLDEPGATMTANVSDAGAGVASPTVTVDVDTSTIGQRLAFVSASDRLGNTTSLFCEYSVGVDIDPIPPALGAIATAKTGKVLAVEWTASDYFGNPVTDPTHFVGLSAVATSCRAGRVSPTSPVGEGLVDLGGGQWRYGWVTPTTKGCYTLTLDAVGDSAEMLIRVT